MSLRNAQPQKFSPVGLSDALDSTNVFPGAMQALQNLIPDVTTKNVWTCRPAAIAAVNFATFVGDFSAVDFNSTDFSTAFNVAGAGFISVIKVVGTRVYGMLATNRNAGHDEPFIYDMVARSFVGLPGVTAANTPISPPTTGDWTPPTMDLIGSKMVVTHPGFTGAGGSFFGWFDLTTFGAPTWNAGNTATNPLPAPPSAVKQFGERAYYVVNNIGSPGLYGSDVLDPLTMTNGTFILTFGDNVPLTALGALPLNNVLGGIIQSLIVFKQNNAFQVTGDFASTTSPTTLNALNVPIGTLSPNGICSTPKGLAFIAIDGIRVVNLQGNIGDPVGFAGMGISAPFTQIVTPSRAAMACNANTLRVALETAAPAGAVMVEYWFDIGRSCFSGPHTCNCALMQPFSNTFVVTLAGVDAILFQSDSVQTPGSTFIENGEQLLIDWETSVLPDDGGMHETNLLETTINIVGAANGATYGLTFTTSDGTVLDTVALVTSSGGTTWGAFTWGGAVWTVSITGLSPVQLDWSVPIVYRKGSVGFTGVSALGFKIGDMYYRTEQLGYLQQLAS
jgi:hypothetical protein